MYQPAQKLNDRNWYLQFSNGIKFEMISDSNITSNQYKSHESVKIVF